MKRISVIIRVICGLFLSCLYYDLDDYMIAMIGEPAVSERVANGGAGQCGIPFVCTMICMIL